jgi:hypothetical protein
MKPALAGFFALMNEHAPPVKLPHCTSTHDGGTLHMDTVMTREEVMKLFMEEADKLTAAYTRQDDTILQLAQLLAESRAMLADENFAALVKVGATLYKANHSRKRARAEIAATMRESMEGAKD